MTEKLPKPEDDFDCYIVNRHSELSMRDFRLLASELACSRSHWVEVFGFGAEQLHDAIDEAAVECGRQSRGGDGRPMTTWSDDLISDQEIASYICAGGQRCYDLKVLVVIGEEVDKRRISDEIISAGATREGQKGTC